MEARLVPLSTLNLAASMAERVTFSPRMVVFHVKRGHSLARLPELNLAGPRQARYGVLGEAFDRFT